jgi:hypothetical protein
VEYIVESAELDGTLNVEISFSPELALIVNTFRFFGWVKNTVT